MLAPSLTRYRTATYVRQSDDIMKPSLVELIAYFMIRQLSTQSGHPATLICKARARTERGLWMATCLDRLVYSLVRGFRSRFCQMGGAGAGASLTTAAVSA